MDLLLIKSTMEKTGATQIPEHILKLPFFESTTFVGDEFQTRYLLQYGNFISSYKRNVYKIQGKLY